MIKLTDRQQAIVEEALRHVEMQRAAAILRRRNPWGGYDKPKPDNDMAIIHDGLEALGLRPAYSHEGIELVEADAALNGMGDFVS